MATENIKLNKTILLLTLVSCAVLSAGLVSAQTAATTTTGIQKTIQASDTAIAKRIASLNTFVDRVSSTQKLSDAEKSSLVASLQNEVNELTNLKTKIDGDTTTAEIKTDAESITKSYRIYMLVLPQASVAAASDRVLSIVDLMTGLQTKIQSRISQLPSTDNTTAIQTAMQDVAAKLADASIQANAAVSGISALVPDQGNTTTASLNTAALKAARSKIKTATADLTSARKDFAMVAAEIKALEKPAATSTSNTSNATGTAQ